MTRGALIFAFNNGAVDYVKLATWTANNIRRHLDIPVALVTDTTINDPIFEHVISTEKLRGNTKFFPDFGNARKEWYNLNRVDSYDLSPWDETLVIDADYIVASDQLKVLFNSGRDFLAHQSAYDITGNDFSEGNYFGRHKMPMWWATVMFFRRGDEPKLIFDIMRMVRDNWQHYCDLYGIRQGSFRNDYALGIAVNIVNGHIQPCSIPWQLPSLMPQHKLLQTGTDSFDINFNNSEGQRRRIQIQGQDLHAMGKRDLGDIIENQI